MKREADSSSDWRKWRLLALDDLALNERHVEDWVFGADCRPVDGVFFDGSSRLPREPPVRWRLLRDLHDDDLIELDDGEGGIPTTLMALRPADVGRIPNRSFRGVARISEEGGGLWERERAIDWSEFHGWSQLEGPGERFGVVVQAAERGVLEAAVARWSAVLNLVVELGDRAEVRPFAATYWKWLERGWEQRLLAAFPAFHDHVQDCAPGPPTTDPWRWQG